MPVKSVPVELGGKTRNLKFGYNALCALEGALGIPISDIGKKLVGSVDLRTVRGLVWAGLIHESPEMTLDEVGNMLNDDLARLGEVSTKVGDAFAAAFETLVKPKNAQAPAGATSPSAGANTSPTLIE